MAKLGPLPDVPNTVKIRLIGQYYTYPWVNVIHAKWTGGTVDATALATVATAIRTNWTTNFQARFITNSGLTAVEVTDISSRTGAQATDGTAVAGGDASAGASASAAVCLSLKIAQRYRGGHPRMYLSGVGSSNFTNGKTITPTLVTNYQNAGRNFRTAINAMTAGGATWKMVAVSYYRTVGGVMQYKSPPETYDITDVVCHTRLDSMRRRLGKETV